MRTGRPPKPPGERLEAGVSFRLTAEAYDALYRHATRGRKSVPEVAREMVLRGLSVLNKSGPGETAVS